MAQALQYGEDGGQLALYPGIQPAATYPAIERRMRRAASTAEPPLCAGCRAREARYGFRSEDDLEVDRPRALCFECFRVEIGRRQAVAARLARGWNAQQVQLPLENTLKELTRRRRRAQIAARHALGV